MKDLELKRAYDSDLDDLIEDFYVPVLSNSVMYRRLAGFFSSSSLAVAAKGMSAFVSGDGRIELVCCAKLSERDVQAVVDASEKPADVLEKTMIHELSDIEDEFVRDHVQALAWMVAQGRMEIKVAVVRDENGVPLDASRIRGGVFHQKVGILEDSTGEMISFSGSENESATAWKSHIEEFKVFRGWMETERDYLRADQEKFVRFWEGSPRRVQIMSVPEAAKARMIEMAPEDSPERALRRWIPERRKPKPIRLWDYQQEALESWVKSDRRGIFEMATGTGKTFTALGCVKETMKAKDGLVTVVTCPSIHLVKQWGKEIKKFGLPLDQIAADSSNPGWKDRLANLFVDRQMNRNDGFIVLTTHSTFRSEDFAKIVRMGCSDKNVTVMLIGDEVHGLGAERTRLGLLEEYRHRLGLSATPRRWFDPSGTDLIYDYFGDTVYEFGLSKAINTVHPERRETYLCPFRYLPRFVSLNDEELELYVKKSHAIIRNYHSAKEDRKREEILKLLLFQRADIIKNAEEKYGVLDEILDGYGRNLKWCLIYCSPQQIDRVLDELRKREVFGHRFTMDTGTKPEDRFGGLSEREYLLKQLAEGKLQTLVAMKCLDEGVDVPPARIAILMSSSGNPREYIQRIGRVVRRYSGKTEATIYDIVVLPRLSDLPSELQEVERKILDREVKRYEEIASNALNSAEAIRLIFEIKERLLEV